MHFHSVHVCVHEVLSTFWFATGLNDPSFRHNFIRTFTDYTNNKTLEIYLNEGPDTMLGERTQ